MLLIYEDLLVDSENEARNQRRFEKLSSKKNFLKLSIFYFAVAAFFMSLGTIVYLLWGNPASPTILLYGDLVLMNLVFYAVLLLAIVFILLKDLKRFGIFPSPRSNSLEFVLAEIEAVDFIPLRKDPEAQVVVRFRADRSWLGPVAICYEKFQAKSWPKNADGSLQQLKNSKACLVWTGEMLIAAGIFDSSRGNKK